MGGADEAPVAHCLDPDRDWLQGSRLVRCLPGAARSNCGLLGTIFLRLIKSIIAPLLFAHAGVRHRRHGQTCKTMGRIGGKAILYFEIVTTIALFVGLGAVNLVQPGVGRAICRSGADAGSRADAAPACSADPGAHLPRQHHRRDGAGRGAADRGVLVHLRRGLRGHREQSRTGGAFCESLAEIMFRYTNYVMYFAPFGVFGAMAATIGEKGFGRPGRVWANWW